MGYRKRVESYVDKRIKPSSFSEELINSYWDSEFGLRQTISIVKLRVRVRVRVKVKVKSQKLKVKTRP